jgi:hypothetical protein
MKRKNGMSVAGWLFSAFLFFAGNAAAFEFSLVSKPAEVFILLNPSLTSVEGVASSEFLERTEKAEETVAISTYNIQVESAELYNWIVPPGSNLSVQVTCPAAADPYSARLVFWDYQGRPVYLKNLGPAPFSLPLNITIQGNGVYLMTVDVLHPSSGYVGRLVRSVAALPDNRDKIEVWNQTNHYAVGTCFFPTRRYLWSSYQHPELTSDQMVEKEIDLAEFLGLQVLRVDRNPSVPFDTNKMDGIVAMVTNHHQKINFKLDAPSGEEAYEPALSAWTSNVVRYVERYQHAAWLFEVGNEPQHDVYFDGTPQEYITLMSNACAAVKAVSPDAMVVSGGFVPAEEGTDTFDWIQEYIASGGAGFGDYAAYHFHTPLSNKDWLQTYKELCSDAGDEDVRWVQTEGARSLWKMSYEVTSSAEIFQKIFWSWAVGDLGWVHFCMMGNVTPYWAGGSGSENWSMFEETTFCPRFPVAQMSALIDRFAGYTEAAVLSDSPSWTLMEFSSAERMAWVWFSGDESVTEQIFEFEAGRVVEVYDSQGNAVNQSSDGTIQVPCSMHPFWIESEIGAGLHLL